MIRSFRQRAQRIVQARTLVLLAALLLGAAPLLEAGHSHSAAEAYADCLLCKKSSDIAVVAAALSAPLATEQQAPPASAPVATPVSLFLTPEIRGPPVFT